MQVEQYMDQTTMLFCDAITSFAELVCAMT